MDLVDDQKADLLDEFGVAGPLSGHNIPLLGGGNDDLRLDDFGFGELHVASILSTLDPKPCKTLSKLLRDFSGQSLHRGHVYDLEIAGINSKVDCLVIFHGVWDNVLRNSMQNGEHSRVSFTLQRRVSLAARFKRSKT